MKNMKNYSNESGNAVCPTTKEELKEIIKKTIKEKDNKCDLNFIDTSKITDMSLLFNSGDGLFNSDCDDFNKFDGDISKWNVSNVKDMTNMFTLSKFNGDISKWNVKGDCDVSNMFGDSSLEYKAPKWYYDIRSDAEYYAEYYD